MGLEIGVDMTTQPRLFDMPIPGVSHYGTPIPDPQQSPAPLADAVAMQEAGVSARNASGVIPVQPPPASALRYSEVQT